jgi:Transcriptional regulatory protein, C terminal
MLPDADGFEVVRRLRQDGCRVPVKHGPVLTRAQLLDHVWDYDFGGSSTVVSTYVAYLRRKLARYGPDVIHTPRGIGYSLRLPRPADPADAAGPDEAWGPPPGPAAHPGPGRCPADHACHPRGLRASPRSRGCAGAW